MSISGWLTAAALIVFIFIVQRPEPLEVEVVNTDPVEVQAEGVAVITKLVDVKFKNQVYRNGQAIGSRIFEIDQGIVQLEFFGGATVVIEGPATLEPTVPGKLLSKKAD